MKASLVAAALPLAMGLESIPTFSAWASAHAKNYGTREELVLRRAIFAANVAKINKHNALYEAGSETWYMGVNQFTDLMPEEFQVRYLGGFLGAQKRTNVVTPVSTSANPASVNWVTAGAVTPVKDQGQCGSCWAFSTTGGAEGAYFVAHGQLLSVSEQQLVSCSKNCTGGTCNAGCNGGLMDLGFDWILSNGGIASEAAYPYTSGNGADGTCKTGETSVLTIKGHTDIAATEIALETAIVISPVSVAVNAAGTSGNDWSLYKGGVYTKACNGNDGLDHGVLAVGYGTDATAGDYYLVKNSWAASWGEQGYIRLGRGAKYAKDGGQCGIELMPTSAQA